MSKLNELHMRVESQYCSRFREATYSVVSYLTIRPATRNPRSGLSSQNVARLEHA